MRGKREIDCYCSGKSRERERENEKKREIKTEKDAFPALFEIVLPALFELVLPEPCRQLMRKPFLFFHFAFADAVIWLWGRRSVECGVEDKIVIRHCELYKWKS